MNLVEEAEALLLHQFSNSPKLKGLTRSLVGPFQDALEHIDTLHNGRYIDEAEGNTLDIIGAIVDFTRNDLRDEEYRVWLKVAVLLNIGQGTAKSVFDILQVLFSYELAIQVDEYEPNVVVFTFFKYPKVPTKILFSIIRKAVPITAICQFVDASTGAVKGDATARTKIKPLPVFQLDVSRFDESVFADFFEEGFSNDQK